MSRTRSMPSTPDWAVINHVKELKPNAKCRATESLAFYCDGTNVQSPKTKKVKGRLSPGFPGNVWIVYHISLSFTAPYVARKRWRLKRSAHTCLRALLPTWNQPGRSQIQNQKAIGLFHEKNGQKGKAKTVPECWEGTQTDICQPMGRKPRSS